jgi:Fe-S cluster biosynthesis and repair protein YggX
MGSITNSEESLRLRAAIGGAITDNLRFIGCWTVSDGGAIGISSSQSFFPISALPLRPMDIDAINRRIAQFETMVRPEADPTNDMAWFSLGGAYAQAGRHLDAAGAYGKCVDLNAGFSKAYQMAGQSLIDANKRDEAIAILSKGFLTATQKGDRMPAKAMSDLLTKIGAPVPEVAKAETPVNLGENVMMDRKTGRPGNRLAKPPMRGPLGAWIQQNVSAETWDAWIKQGTKVINEMRLDLSRDQDAETYDKHMLEYLGVDEDMLAEILGPSA